MIVNSKQMRQLRRSRNWTQQHLAEVCDLSIRTIQRVEKDGVASNETVAAYAAIFEIKVDELLIGLDDFGHTKRQDSNLGMGAFFGSVLFAMGLASGIGLTLWFF